MNPADDEESKRPLFQSWVGELRELPENAKVSSVRFPEVSSLIAGVCISQYIAQAEAGSGMRPKVTRPPAPQSILLE